jgi:hypothetical protein
MKPRDGNAKMAAGVKRAENPITKMNREIKAACDVLGTMHLESGYPITRISSVNCGVDIILVTKSQAAIDVIYSDSPSTASVPSSEGGKVS